MGSESFRARPETLDKENQPEIRSESISTQHDETEISNNTQVPTDKNDDHITGLKLYTLFLALLLIVLMMSLDASIMATAIPRVTDDFHTIKDIGWYGAGYMIANSCLQPLTGKFYTFFPLRMTLFVFVAVFELGSILCATATSSTMLVIGRAVAGMGGSGLANGSLTLIGVAAPPSQRPTITGIIMSMFGVGQVIGPLIGGALTQHASWRWCFWINLPIGAASIFGLLAVRLPPQDEKPKLTRQNFLQNFDIVGFFFFAPASIMLLLGLQWGGIKYNWSSATIIGLFCGSAVNYLVFVLWERHQGDHAMFPASLLTQLPIGTSMLFAFLVGGALLVSAYYLPLWFQVIKHDSPTKSAISTLPSFISQISFAIISGPVSNLLGFFTPLALTGASISAIGTGLMSTFAPTTGVGKWIGFQVLAGVGRGLAFQQPINVVLAALPRNRLSTGMALVIWAQFFGGAVMLGLAQTAFSSMLKTALERYASNIDPIIVIEAGATNYVNVIPVAEQGEVLLAYNQAITQTFYLPSAVLAAAAVISLGMGWKRVVEKKKTKAKKTEEAALAVEEKAS